jgi:hypothetical protein
MLQMLLHVFSRFFFFLREVSFSAHFLDFLALVINFLVAAHNKMIIQFNDK